MFLVPAALLFYSDRERRGRRDGSSGEWCRPDASTSHYKWAVSYPERVWTATGQCMLGTSKKTTQIKFECWSTRMCLFFIQGRLPFRPASCWLCPCLCVNIPSPRKLEYKESRTVTWHPGSSQFHGRQAATRDTCEWMEPSGTACEQTWFLKDWDLSLIITSGI